MNKEELVRNILEKLNVRYPKGLYEFLYRYHPELYRRMIDIEDSIDQNLLNADSSIDQLRSILREYWTLHMRAIQIFKDSGKVDSDFRKAREEILEDRLST